MDDRQPPLPQHAKRVWTMPELRYFDTAKAEKDTPVTKTGVHTEFLRTGRITRRGDDWHPAEKRYLTHKEVAERTGRKLEAAGSQAHERINSFHASIRFPKIVYHRTLSGRPHLGYCHVTSAKTKFAEFDDVRWSFYIANFFADVSDKDLFFKNISLGYSRMFFAVAMERDAEEGKLVVDRKIRDDGLLFRTRDPKAALKNVLMLGAVNESLRKIIQKL